MKPTCLSDVERHLDDLKSGQSPARSNWSSIDCLEFMLERERYLDSLLKPKTLGSIVEKHCRINVSGNGTTSVSGQDAMRALMNIQVPE